MISIIVPVYNVERFISTTIQSVVQQEGFSDWELILVNDGSTDSSGEICNKFAKEDNRIYVINKSNGGLSSARNAGLDAAKGEYVLFLDGDDCLDVVTLQILNRLAEINPQCDFFQFRYEEVQPSSPYGHRVPNKILEYKELYNEQDFFLQLYRLGGVAASACTKLIKRSILENLRFEEGFIHEDELFTTALLAHCSCIGYCSNEFYKYVMRAGSIQRSSFSLNKLQAIEVLNERIDYLHSRGYDKLVQLFKSRLYGNLLMLWNEAKVYRCKDALIIIERQLDGLCTTQFPLTGIKQNVIYHSTCFRHFALCLFYDSYKIGKPIVQKFRNAKIKYNRRKERLKNRSKLRCLDFSIISNNCWGGLVYQRFALPYTSPTIGLFIMDDDYIKFLEHLDYYLAQPLKFITKGQSRYVRRLLAESTAKSNYPIGLLDDVEVHFLHYSSEKEAFEKWEKRKKRLNKKCLLVKFSQRSSTGVDILSRFSKLPYKNKICFTEYDYPGDEFIKVDELKNLNIQGGDETPYVMDKIDIIEILNKLR